MMRLSILGSVAALLVAGLMGCQAEPGLKKIPKNNKVKVDKKLNDVSFNPAVDILFIIDDSYSMNSFQDLLAKNAADFVERFFSTKFIDYHIGVTTSSTSSYGSIADGGKLVNVDGLTYVDRNTADALPILKRMMRVGVNGSANETFFNIFINALSAPLTNYENYGFYRESAQLAIFFLTDTEDKSSFDASSAYGFLKNLKGGDEKKLHMAGALSHVVPDCLGEYEPPRKLEFLINEHQDRGFIFNLCAPDYGKEMAIIAEKLVSAVSTVYLDELPDVTTMSVTFGDYVIPNDKDKGWVYDPDKNAIYLSPNIDIREPEPQTLKINFESIYK